MTLEPLHGLLTVATPPTPTPTEPDPLLGALAVRDTDLPGLGDDPPLPIALDNTGGAGQLAGPAGLCARRGLPLVAVTTTLRDLDDLAGNVRRVVAAVDAARGEGVLGDDVVVRVALPAEPATYGWLAAADEVAAAELELALPVHDGIAPAATVTGWIDAALDRETGFAALGVATARQALCLLDATAVAWDGGGVDEATRALASPAPSTDPDTWATGRRWCRAVHVLDPAVADALRQFT